MGVFKERYIVILILALFLLPPAWGASDEPTVKFKDVPNGHWAAPAVYDLVKLGVTKGYPDGTYRGNKPITRYETAMFLSKLSQSLSNDDLRTDIQQLRDQLLEVKKNQTRPLVVTGGYEGDWKVGNILSTSGQQRGSVANYRLVVSSGKEFSDSANLKVNLDTMDYGYYDDGSASTPGRGLLATELFDIESNVNLDLSAMRLSDPVKLKLTYGPGDKQHQADPTNVLPSEVGIVYQRPYTGVAAETKLLNLDVKGGYYSVQGQTFEVTGKVNTSRLVGGLGYTFNRFLLLSGLRIDLIGDYMSRGLFSTQERNIKARVELLAPLGDKAAASGTVSMNREPSRMLVAGKLTLNDVWDTGTVISMKAAKVGSQFISSNFSAQQFDWAGLDYFNRPLENGTVNLGGELVQQVSDRAKLIGKGDLRLSGDYKYEGPKARLTAQGGISYNLAPEVNLDAAYRVYQDKGLNDTSDLAQVGLIYRF